MVEGQRIGKENYPESILLDKYDLKKIENIIDLY